MERGSRAWAPLDRVVFSLSATTMYRDLRAVELA